MHKLVCARLWLVKTAAAKWARRYKSRDARAAQTCNAAIRADHGCDHGRSNVSARDARLLGHFHLGGEMLVLGGKFLTQMGVLRSAARKRDMVSGICKRERDMM